MIFTNKRASESCGCATQENVVYVCPSCGTKGSNVNAITVKSQLKKEVRTTMKLDVGLFNFCTNPQCDTVYYSNDGSEIFLQSDIKSKVTIKNEDPKTPLCYCKKLLKESVIEMINRKEPAIAKKVKEIIADGKSFCEKSNPKGTCCTEDITSFLKGYGIDFNESKKTTFSLNPNALSSCCC
ncbi:MAG: hypothetical protein GW906_01670 [Epsilonproteobacteria bacterium]|nr:hypothetical protein [Campylobacterota bacterium]OIO15445.1 MAG: hypothetical protein AUJ81_07160 [Helicobacteraceae bacterium CG1_02_36_14]PIP10985.1 MAG: hypothetical protein COX50_03000 [Sulfurimonas sp. CG23_combo_of_CG06-09_8_20_14_all_36_33]PIS25793.1 MAG: hypothetical protein COT46_04840 [Sulfurimonas sp. CG08_land_8_20_14_0_20_36_33]PIU34393.1 MAG: hypothetical protein COT05_07785 [Sulfurimonas sp. CG07_land_8_20_14_0_80_36_56]PIV02735.1 MAG: hypothetical protein COS56_10895 [Sulfur